jgi:hypothetical protein
MFDDTSTECRMVSTIASRPLWGGFLLCKHHIMHRERGEVQQSTYYVQLQEHIVPLPVVGCMGEGFLETRLSPSIGTEYCGVGGGEP